MTPKTIKDITSNTIVIQFVPCHIIYSYLFFKY